MVDLTVLELLILCIDDLLRGYQTRHENSWLLVEVDLVDDSSLSNELQQAPRSRDLITKGVFWPSLTEIELVGYAVGNTWGKWL